MMTGSKLRAGFMILACFCTLALIPFVAAAETVSACGDSITENTIPPRLEPMLEEATGADWIVWDNGIGGYTTHDLRDAMAAGCWWCPRPTYTLIMAGTNDMVHRYDINGSVGAMQDMVNMMRRGSDRIIISLIIPSLSVGETNWARDYNQRLQERLSGVDYFIKGNWDEIYNPDTGTARGELMRDRLHPNDDGVEIISRNYRDVILSRRADPNTEKVNNYR
jgi:lysophospholipase L1-like esterase